MKKKIVILGATSFIGRHLCTQLCDEFDICAIIRPNSPFKSLLCKKNLEIIEYNLFDANCLDRAKNLTNKIGNCDVLIILAWAKLKKEDRNNYELNHRSMRYLYEYIEAFCNKFPEIILILAGTQAEYGLSTGVVNENTFCNPISEYGKAKYDLYRKATRLCLDREINIIELRIHSIYGEDDESKKMLTNVMEKLEKNESVVMQSSCNQMWNFLFVDDLCEVISRCIKIQIPSGVYNVGSAEHKTLREYLEIASQVICGEYKIQFGSSKDESVPDFVYDCSKLMKAIDWFPAYSFEEGIRVCDWKRLQLVSRKE